TRPPRAPPPRTSIAVAWPWSVPRRGRIASSRTLLALRWVRTAMLLPEPLPLLRRRAAPLLAEPLALLGRHLTPALARLRALLRGQRLPATVVLEHARPLFGREAPPPLEVPLGDHALLGGELFEPRERLGLAPRALGAPGQQEDRHDEKARQPAGLHGHFTSLRDASVGICESRTGSVSSILRRSMTRIRVRKRPSRAKSASFRRSRSRSICASGLESTGGC